MFVCSLCFCFLFLFFGGGAATHHHCFVVCLLVVELIGARVLNIRLCRYTCVYVSVCVCVRVSRKVIVVTLPLVKKLIAFWMKFRVQFFGIDVMSVFCLFLGDDFSGRYFRGLLINRRGELAGHYLAEFCVCVCVDLYPTCGKAGRWNTRQGNFGEDDDTPGVASVQADNDSRNEFSLGRSCKREGAISYIYIHIRVYIHVYECVCVRWMARLGVCWWIYLGGSSGCCARIVEVLQNHFPRLALESRPFDGYGRGQGMAAARRATV